MWPRRTNILLLTKKGEKSRLKSVKTSMSNVVILVLVLEFSMDYLVPVEREVAAHSLVSGPTCSSSRTSTV